MTDAKPTPGPWYGIRPDGKYLIDHPWDVRHEDANYEVYAPVSDKNCDVVCLVVAASERFADPIADKLVDDRCALIAEAGTVHHETGLTPRQLAEQRAELLEALQIIEYNRNKGYRLTDADYSAIRRVIATARGWG